MPLTTKQIEAAKFGISPERLPDGLGLYLRLYRSGAKAFETRVTCAGKRSWIQIGYFPAIGLKSARHLAGLVHLHVDTGQTVEQVRAMLQSGDIEPPGEAQQKPVAMPEQEHVITFQEMTKTWFEQKKLGLRNGKHIQQNWNTIETYIFPHFGDRPIVEISTTEVVEAIRPIWHKKNETAKRTLGRVKEIFALAKIHELRPDNPADFPPDIALGRVKRKKGHFGALPFEQIPDLWSWIQTAGCEEHTRQLSMLMILTAKRSKESRYARWEFFDAEGNVWTTPEELMKMSREHRVPISAQLAIVINNMQLLTGDAPNLFYKPKNKTGVVSENTVCKFLKKYQPGITAHGLRSGFRTWARRQQKYSDDAMEFALAHEQDDLEAAYQREDLIEERAIMMQDWADFVTAGQSPSRLLSKEEQEA